MNANIGRLKLAAVLCIALCISNFVFASSQDSSEKATKSDASTNVSFDNELDVTVYFRVEALLKNRLYSDSGQSDFIDYLGLSIGVDAYYGKLFIENSSRFSQNRDMSTFGYRLFDETDYQFDILIGQSYLPDLDENQGNVYRSTPSEALVNIDERHSDFNQGIRFTQFSESSAWWVDIAGDIFNQTHGGWVVDAYYSSLHPVFNWELQFGVGATYYSKAVVDYHVGISAHEVTVLRPLYSAEHGMSATLDIATQYPLTNNWVFIAGVSFKTYSSEFSDSPLFNSRHQTLFNLGALYVW